MPKKNDITRFRPDVSKSVHLFAAPLIWTAVGIMLMIRGLGWIGFSLTGWLLFIALFIGTIKSLTILDKSAKKNLNRIMTFNEKSCIGAVYPWRTWLLVILMMATGIALRSMTEPGLFLGTVYLAVGWGLLLSSRHGWEQWLRRIRSR
ncbi:hypothetical protein VT98_11872 [Candidatus Electrothrix communis]|uniref:Uncharacterized protein n=1 Tax=Candidatus Electrothrix communis TaxID=1859133 RepID=A0A444J4I2_9BACT|nr:hypothetical protein [Desulfobulbus sp. US5]RWX47969.1 hypothetical protein VT98_11872 [Candidatus Electrothrix communis]WLE96235.1 MAG: hypothetical protein QTN59_16305 [Candidatus Electrothrix communis]